MQEKPRFQRALVLSGGGAKGIYEVGCLKRLCELDPALDFDYFLGISAGALNAAFLALAEPGPVALRAQIDALAAIWHQQIQGPDDIYRGNIEASKADLVAIAAGKDSLLDATPIRRLIERYLGDKPVQRQLHLGACSLERGTYQAFEFVPGVANPDIDLVRAVKASTAVPALFRPVPWHDDWLVDGAIRDNTPLGHAFAACPAEIVVIQTSPLEGGVEPMEFDMGSRGIATIWNPGKSALDVLLRAARILADEVQKDDVRGAVQWNMVLLFVDDMEAAATKAGDEGTLEKIRLLRRGISKKDANGNIIPRRAVRMRLFAPEKALLKDELDFKKHDLDRMWQLGMADATRPA